MNTKQLIADICLVVLTAIAGGLFAIGAGWILYAIVCGWPS